MDGVFGYFGLCLFVRIVFDLVVDNICWVDVFWILIVGWGKFVGFWFGWWYNRFFDGIGGGSRDIKVDLRDVDWLVGCNGMVCVGKGGMVCKIGNDVGVVFCIFDVIFVIVFEVGVVW